MKKNIYLLILITTFLFLPHTSYSAELLTNGSFETGNFTGWTTNSTQASNYCANWLITTNSAYACLQPSNPNDGTYVALNGFDGSGGVFTIYQDVTIPTGVSARLTFMFRPQWSIPSSTNLPRKFEVQIRDPATNNLLETIYTFTANSGIVNHNAGWQTKQAWITQYVGQSVRLYFIETIPQSFTGPGQFELDGIKLETFFPTAASVGVGGQVRSENGYGIGRATVSFVDDQGNTRTAITNNFGYFSFDNVEAGNTYVFQAWHRAYDFNDNPRVIFLDGARKDLIFTANSAFSGEEDQSKPKIE